MPDDTRKYKVSIFGIAFVSATIEVDASSEKEARELAVENSKHSDYKVERIEDIYRSEVI